PRVSLKTVDIVAALLLFPACLYVFYESGRWPILPDMGNPAWIPRGVAACLFGAACVLMVRALQGRAHTLPSRLEGTDRTRVLLAVSLTAGYVIAVERLGFIASTALYLLGFVMTLGERRWWRLAVFAAVVPVIAYLVFDAGLNVPLPRGWLR
ncbi:MAG: tripartite tricarboxylate transporter TctB family protein, partial [Zetaproteobacteria bacterium]